jgi:TonB family protein
VPERFANLPAEAQRDTLVHELAHIARFDFVTTLLACAVCALYWFQPLAWLALRRMALETERACDDRVLLAGGARTSYAAELLETAHAIRRFRRPMAATAMARSSAVSARIASILDPDVRRKPVSKKYVALVLVLTAAMLVPLASLKSQETAAQVSTDITTPASTDLNDPAFLALVQKGPANDDELSRIVNAYVAQGRQADAAAVLADYISREMEASDASSPAAPTSSQQRALQRIAAQASCGFCSDAIGAQASAQGASGETAKAVLAAFDEVEHRARQNGDGNLLIRLAATCVATEDKNMVGRGTYYLIEGFRLGHLSEESNFAAIYFLIQRGWDTEAKELAQRLYDDASSSLYQSKALQTQIRTIDARIAQRGNITKRLLTPNGTVTFKDDADVIPLYRQPPAYPPSALKQHIEGMAQLQFTVTDEGKTKGITVVEATNDEFGQSAAESVSHWLYAPDVANGVAVERPNVHTIIRFVLAD